jgi:plastocyanin
MKRALYLSLLGVLVIMGLLAAVSCGSSTATTKPGGGLQTSPPPGTTTGPDIKPFAVTIKDMAFSPATVEVAIGTTVTWTNEDSLTHTVTSRTGIFDSGSMSKGMIFSHTFNNVGDFEYFCSIHTSMVGHIIVK